ncbi:MAG: prolyl oligopeptidase family serine peptidase [Armatimonadia bacterium]
MHWYMTIVLSLALATAALAAPAVTDLQAQYRNGQVFLTWNETPGLEGTLVVRMSLEPITAANVAQAAVVAEGLNPRSADDWWLNPETYGNPLEKGKVRPPREGFLIAAGGQKLNPDSGLHVHTVGTDEVGSYYYAVTTRDAAGVDDLDVTPGTNALAQPVAQKVEAVEPIWQKTEAPLDPATTKGMPMHLILHAKTGIGGMEFLAFGDKSLGWREGLPFKFGVRISGDAVIVTPTDRTWIGRMFPEGRDGCQKLTPAIHSFWYGYNSNINKPEKMAEGVATNYTERRVLWIMDWVQKTFQTDPNRIYASGSSMGGCGMMAVAFRHPERFAAIYAHVPIVAYDKGVGGDSLMRIVAECGDVDKPCSEGMTVRERLDATKFAREHKGDLPFLLIANGRKDMSIPWWKNPDFYRAMRDNRHGFVAAWNEGDHGGCGGALPEDIKRMTNLRSFYNIALNKSYLAFSNSSLDDDPGNGDAANGTPVGYMNRGLWWEEPVDEAGRYEVVVKWTLEAEKLPVTVDVTPRRLQAFRLKPGETVTARNIAVGTGAEVQKETLKVDEDGLLTFKGFKVTAPEGNRLVLSR